MTVPYIVRVERGTMDRGIYDIAVLSDPAAWRVGAAGGWNHKLVTPFGAEPAAVPQAVDPDHGAGRQRPVARLHGREQLAPDPGQERERRRHAESVMMLKEHILERYGSIRYTIGQGCSGGSIGQHLLASTYPGLLDGITPQCSFPDTWTTGLEVTDCALLARYWETASTAPALWAALPQRAFVSGHQTAASCNAWIQSSRSTSR